MCYLYACNIWMKAMLHMGNVWELQAHTVYVLHTHTAAVYTSWIYSMLSKFRQSLDKHY